MSKLMVRALLVIWVLLVLAEVAKAGTAYVPDDAPPVPATQPAVQVALGLARSVHGHAAAVAATGSMVPAITAEDIIVYRPVSLAELGIGDIILFEGVMPGCRTCAPSVYAHRVTSVVTESATVGRRLFVDADHHYVRTSGTRSVVSEYVTTKGDANETADAFRTTQDKLRGVVEYVLSGQTGAVRYARGLSH